MYTKKIQALAGWLGWLEHCPVHQRVVGSIPIEGTYVGGRFDPWLGYVLEVTD